MAFSVGKKDIIKYEPNDLRNFNLFIHEYIDNLHFTLPVSDFLPNADEYVAVAEELFREAGWDGDGEVRLMWIPPFMISSFTDREEALGVTVWYVKQFEDGIAWLLSPIKLPLPE